MHAWLRLTLMTPIVAGSLVFCGNSVKIIQHLGVWAVEVLQQQSHEPRRDALNLHLKRKTQTVDEIVAGRMSLQEASEVFAWLHREHPICTSAHLRNCFAPTEPEATMAEIFRRQVQAFLDVRQRDLADELRRADCQSCNGG